MGLYDYLNDPVFRATEALLIWLNRECYPDRQACHMLARAKHYLERQAGRAPHYYTLQEELDRAGESTRALFCTDDTPRCATTAPPDSPARAAKTAIERADGGPVRIVIVVNGGNVQNVYSSDPELKVDILDWDNIREVPWDEDEAVYRAALDEVVTPGLVDVDERAFLNPDNLTAVY